MSCVIWPVNLSPGETSRPEYGNPDSGIRKILISCLWNPESVLAESGIQAFGKFGIQLNVSEIPLTIWIRNPVPVIRNEQRGIQNRRLYMGQDVFGRNDHNYNSYRSFRPASHCVPTNQRSMPTDDSTSVDVWGGYWAFPWYGERFTCRHFWALIIWNKRG